MARPKKRRVVDPQKRNEPMPKLPGGTRRASVKVDRPAAIARRERLERMLIAHDLEPADRVRMKLTAEDHAVLRQIALEGAIANSTPAVRAHAILYLASEASVEDLNVLADLARHGEDHIVRGHALIAIGASGVRLGEPLLVQGLVANHAFERAAAEKGLLALGRRVGASAVRWALADDQFRAVRQRLEERLAGGTRPGRSPRRSTTVPEPT